MLNRNIPFTIEQLVFFKGEVMRAGDFDALMIDKKALKLDGVTLVVALYENIEEYKEKFLTGIYEPLRKYFDTQAPYMFWGEMNDMLSQLKRDRKQKFHLMVKAEEKENGNSGS